MIHYSCKKILRIDSKNIYRKWTINIALFAAVLLGASKIRIPLFSYVHVIAYAALLMVLMVVVFGGAAYIYDRETCNFIMQKIRRGAENEKSPN